MQTPAGRENVREGGREWGSWVERKMVWKVREKKGKKFSFFVSQPSHNQLGFPAIVSYATLLAYLYIIRTQTQDVIHVIPSIWYSRYTQRRSQPILHCDVRLCVVVAAHFPPLMMQGKWKWNYDNDIELFSLPHHELWYCGHYDAWHRLRQLFIILAAHKQDYYLFCTVIIRRTMSFRFPSMKCECWIDFFSFDQNYSISRNYGSFPLWYHMCTHFMAKLDEWESFCANYDT